MIEARKKSVSKSLIKEIKKVAHGEIKIMHVCGTHEATVSRWGLRKLLPRNIKVICGPGCPVCVTSAREIDLAIKLALEKKVILTTFGDIFRVLGSSLSLSEAKSKGAEVRVVYGIDEAINLAKKNPKKEIVHLAIGFETTAPTTAVEIIENQNLKNFFIICSHRLIPPAMESLLNSGQSKLDGFICPGHVSTIIGSLPYEPLAKKFNKPFVISGFEPNDVLLSILMILTKIKNKKNNQVQIEYTRAVNPEGNVLAQKIMEEVFEVCDKNWRGIGMIPKSGLQLKKKFAKFSAEKKFKSTVNKIMINSQDIKPGCKCGQIMKGLAEPKDCPYFKKICRPDSPLGACIVSIEGPCNVAFKYGY